AALVVFLKDCARQKDLYRGSRLHAIVVRKGSLNLHHNLGSSLVNLYAKCGKLAAAQQVFEELVQRDVVAWTALITGYAQHGHDEKAFSCFYGMQSIGLVPNAVTFACILKACANMGSAERGIALHTEIMRKGLLGDDIVLGNALMDMYFKSGLPFKAKEVFDELPFHDVVSWNALISGYAQFERNEDALDCFEKMQQEGLCSDPVTLLSILPVCGSREATEKGIRIHAKLVEEGLLEEDCALGTALINMYAKCGVPTKAHCVFLSVPVQDVATWNAIIAGYADVGKHDFVFILFSEIIGEGIDPTVITFVSLLNVCSQLGLVDDGCAYFKSMRIRYGIIPTLEHYACMVDLYGRAGCFERAMETIEEMPSLDCLPAWSALLGACRKWENVNIGMFAYQHAIQLDRKTAVVYTYMRDIFMAAGMDEHANKIETMRLANEARW
ncbi:hypothetical protein KP509_33G047500, partial [Ceratopteris richardii]